MGTAGRESSRGFLTTICIEKQDMQESQTEKEEMRQQQRMKVMTKNDESNQEAEWTRKTVGLAADCQKSLAQPRMGRDCATMVQLLSEMKKKDEGNRMRWSIKSWSVVWSKLLMENSSSAQYHQANGVERRSAGSEGGSRCQVIGQT